MNAANKNIDALLEQVAEALADGKNELAAHLLPEILQLGDEVQRLMAESYLMQIDALQALEQDTLKPEDTASLIDSAALDTEGSISSQPSDLETEKAIRNTKSAIKITDSLTDTVDIIDPALAQNFDNQPVSGTLNTDTINQDSDYLTASISEKSSTSEDTQTTKEKDVVTDNTTAQKITETDSTSDLEVSDISCAVDNEEIDTALMQAEILIADKEYETAELVLQTALESEDDASRSKAKAMMLQIASAEISKNGGNPTISAFLDKHEEPVTQTSVIDAIFEEGYEGFANQEDKPSVPQKEKSHSSDILAIETQITDNESSNEKESVNTDKIVENSYENLVEHKVIRESEESLSGEKTFTELAKESETNATTEEIEKTIVTEVFSDNEEISHLLSPVLALQGFDNPLDINTAQRKIVSVESIQRQGFYIGNVGLMIDFANGSELTEMPDFFKAPNAPKWFIGLANMHGVVIPIFDLQSYFNIANDSSNTPNKKMLLVLKYDKKEKVFGIIVDGLPTRLSWSSTQKVNTNTSPASIRSHINTACLIDGDLWFDLDTETLANTLQNAI